MLVYIVQFSERIVSQRICDNLLLRPIDCSRPAAAALSRALLTSFDLTALR